MQMFIWNNIFFSLGFDVRDHYKEFGGDHAAYVAPVSVKTLYVTQHITVDQLRQKFKIDSLLVLKWLFFLMNFGANIFGI